MIKRALMSVSNKGGLVDFAKGLAAKGVEILSTGGTAKALREGGVPVIEVSDYTGFPEMMDPRYMAACFQDAVTQRTWKISQSTA